MDPVIEKSIFLCLCCYSNTHNWMWNETFPVASDCWEQSLGAKTEENRCLYFPPSVLKKTFRCVPSKLAKRKAGFAAPTINPVTSSLYTKTKNSNTSISSGSSRVSLLHQAFFLLLPVPSPPPRPREDSEWTAVDSYIWEVPARRGPFSSWS